MADLFSVTAPLMIRHATGAREVMIERFRHPNGLLYFVPFWHLGNPEETVRLVEGEIRGEGANGASLHRAPRLDSRRESRAMQQGCCEYGFDPIGEGPWKIGSSESQVRWAGRPSAA